MLGAHSLVSVREEHHEARLTDPLGLTRRDELVDDALGSVGEVTELRLKERICSTYFTILSRSLSFFNFNFYVQRREEIWKEAYLPDDKGVRVDHRVSELEAKDCVLGEGRVAHGVVGLRVGEVVQGVVHL